MRARALIERSNVKLVCTTDDPADDLRYHRLLAADAGFSVRVLPAWRPDKAVAIEKPDFADYIARLGESAGCRIATFAELKTALHARMDFFHENGCRLSDHGLLRMVCPARAGGSGRGRLCRPPAGRGALRRAAGGL